MRYYKVGFVGYIAGDVRFDRPWVHLVVGFDLHGLLLSLG